MGSENGVSMKTAFGAKTDMRRSTFGFDHPLPKVSINVRPSSRVSCACSGAAVGGSSSVDMLLNLHLSRALRAVFVASLAPLAAGAQAPCAPVVAANLAAAWTAYRAGALDTAAVRFGRADSLCPNGVDGKLGLGFVGLRQDRPREADSLFRLVLAHDSNFADAWDGHARSAWRLGDTTTAVAAARRGLALDPRNTDLRAWLDRVAPERGRPAIVPRRRPASLQLVARTRGDRFEIRRSQGWTPFYVQGVNLGVALPGRFPAEFPTDSALYAGWLDTIAGMRANTVRVYTILPPAFYRALRGWNRTHPARALWLVHGVWTELPPGNDFDDAEWKEEFRREMRRVADVVHGAAEIPARPGHAGGRYDADVSRWTLGYIIGREWEPYAVKAYDGRDAAPASYRGRYLDLARGTPTRRMDGRASATTCSATRWRRTTRSGRSHIPTGRRSIRSTIRPNPPRGGAPLAQGARGCPGGDGREPRGGRGLAGRVARAADGGEPGGLVRQLPCVSVLPGLHELRSGLPEGAARAKGRPPTSAT